MSCDDKSHFAARCFDRVTMHDRLVMYDSLRCSFMSIKKPPKQSKCPVCSLTPSIRSMDDSREFSLSARGPSCSLDGGKPVSLDERPPIAEDLEVSCVEYNRVRTEEIPHILLDVRVKEQFDLCSLDGAVNIPLEKLEDQLERVEELSNGTKPVFCICRRGLLSVLATNMLNDAAAIRPRIHSVKNIEGGLATWQIDVDHMFPKY
jgi:adenylyltransferase/sulfurtransferase